MSRGLSVVAVAWLVAVTVTASRPLAAPQQPAPAAAATTQRALLDKYCVTCHNQRTKTAGLTLDTSSASETTGQVLRVPTPTGSTTQFTYDGAGRRVKEQVDPEGRKLPRQY